MLNTFVKSTAKTATNSTRSLHDRIAYRHTLHGIVQAVVLTITLTGLLASCRDDGLAPETGDQSSLYWDLRVTPGAIQMDTAGPYKTLQLSAVAYAADGSVMTITDTSASTVWSSSDSSKVYVSQAGVITGLVESDMVTVYASHRIGKQTRKDSTMIRVKHDPIPPVLTTFSIVPQDSLKRAFLNIFTPYDFPVTALDASGTAVTGFPIRWYSSNSKTARPSTWGFGWDVSAIGDVQVSAKAWVYGVAVSDSFNLDIGWPIWLLWPGTEVKQVVAQSGTVTFAPVDRIVDLGPGGMLPFVNNSGRGPTNIPGARAIEGKIVDIIFDDPSVALGTRGFPGDTSGIAGNILGLKSDTTADESERTQWRRFLKPGIHFYTIQPFGVRGSIHVHDK